MGIDLTAKNNDAIKQAWTNNHIKVVSLLALHPSIKAERDMPKDLQQTIGVIKGYYRMPTNYYQFFKTPKLIKDVKQYIMQMGLAKLKKELPQQVNAQMVIEALMSFKQTDLINRPKVCVQRTPCCII